MAATTGGRVLGVIDGLQSIRSPCDRRRRALGFTPIELSRRGRTTRDFAYQEPGASASCTRVARSTSLQRILGWPRFATLADGSRPLYGSIQLPGDELKLAKDQGVLRDLDDWIDASIGPRLRAEGYRKGRARSRYQRPAPDMCRVIEFQRSDASSSGREKFTVNLGVWSRAVGLATGTTRLVCPTWSDCHIGLRLGELGSNRAEMWWWIDPRAVELDVSTAVVAALEEDGFPFLDQVGTPAGFRAFWEAQGGTAGSYFLELFDLGSARLT